MTTAVRIRRGLRIAVRRARHERGPALPFTGYPESDDQEFARLVHKVFPERPMPSPQLVRDALTRHSTWPKFANLPWPHVVNDTSTHNVVFFMLRVESNELFAYYLPAMMLADIEHTTGFKDPVDVFDSLFDIEDWEWRHIVDFFGSLTEEQLTVFEHYIVRRLRALPPEHFDPHTRDAVQLLRALKILQLRLWRYLEIP